MASFILNIFIIIQLIADIMTEFFRRNVMLEVRAGTGGDEVSEQ